jgi:hypothetical protein
MTRHALRVVYRSSDMATVSNTKTEGHPLTGLSMTSIHQSGFRHLCHLYANIGQ